jgi:hypothetical protein
VRWTPFDYAGRQYDLSHLHPQSVEFVQPAKGSNPERVYRVQIIFSLHCFIRAADDTFADSGLLYRDSRESRVFDFRRYEFSHHLPAITMA